MKAVTPRDDEARFDEFMRTAHREASGQSLQNSGEHALRFTTAFKQELAESDALRGTLYETLADVGRNVDPDVFFRRVQKSVQYIVEREVIAEGGAFPTSITEEEQWRQQFRRLTTDTAFREDFEVNALLPIMSNVWQRHILTKLVASLHHIRTNVELLEFGCSRNFIPITLAHSDETAFAEQKLVVNRWQARRFGATAVSRKATLATEELLHSGFKLGIGTGIDPMPFHLSQELRDRAKSDTLYLDEKADPKKVETLNLLDSYSNTRRDTNIYFRSIDAAQFDIHEVGTLYDQEDHGDLLRQDQQYDIVLASAMLYQKRRQGYETPSPDQVDSISKILERGRAALKPDGLFIVQDFIRYFRGGTPSFYADWNPYTYGVWVEDQSRPDLGFQHYFSVKSGRGDAIVPEKGIKYAPMARELGYLSLAKQAK